jgi:hypothetical protein
VSVITKKKIKKILDFFFGGVGGKLGGSDAGAIGIGAGAGITGFIGVGLGTEGKGFGVTVLGDVMIII